METDNKGKESTALAVTLANDKALGEIYKESGLFPDTKSKAQAIVKIQAGREIGLQPIEAMTGLNIFSGKISIGGNVMASNVKGNPKYDYRATITDESCSIDFFEFTIDEKGKPIREKLGNSTFTMEDAKKAKLSTKDNWMKWSRNMMFNRALSNGVKWYCPDVFGSSPVYTPDELGIDENEAGEPINVTPPPSKQPTVVKQCSECGGAIPKDNETGLCVLCLASGNAIQEAEFDDVHDEPEPEGFTDEEDELFEQEKRENEGTVEDEDSDTVTLSIPGDLIDDAMKPREAFDTILKYAMDKGIGGIVRPVIVKHYKKYDDGSRYPYHIPESKVIKIVEELTGIKTKKAEKVKKCSECQKRVTEAEAYEQKDGQGQPLCLKCWLKENE